MIVRIKLVRFVAKGSGLSGSLFALREFLRTLHGAATRHGGWLAKSGRPHHLQTLFAQVRQESMRQFMRTLQAPCQVLDVILLLASSGVPQARA